MSRESHRYSVYGVALTSDWPLAFPPSVDGPAAIAEIDFITGTDDDFSGLDALRDPAGPWFVSHVFPDQSTYIRWSGLYEFRIPADGSRVACRSLDGDDRLVLQNFLFCQALSFALLRKGLEPLHAAAVRVGDTAVGLLGDCTFGKSTMLASFVRAGHRVLTDDLLMVVTHDGRPMACPGSGRIKLHPDSARTFLEDADGGERLNPLTLKRSFPLEARHTQRTGLPLSHLFVLPTPEERKTISSISIERLPRTAMVREILMNSFNVEILTRERLARQFAYAAQLASDVDGFRLQYPDGLDQLPLVRQCIVDHIRETATVPRRQHQ